MLIVKRLYVVEVGELCRVYMLQQYRYAHWWCSFLDNDEQTQIQSTFTAVPMFVQRNSHERNSPESKNASLSICAFTVPEEGSQGFLDEESSGYC